MRSNEQIEGITTKNFEVKLSAYADDTYFFALDIQSLLAVLDTCKTFQELIVTGSISTVIKLSH